MGGHKGDKVFVVGVGMTKFEKPGSRDWDYPDMGREAGEKALADAGIPYDTVEQAAIGYCYGDSTAGQAALYQLGLTGIPAINVNNNCSTGSSALYYAKKMVEGGMADCAMAIGFEKMEKGSLGMKFEDRIHPMTRHTMAMIDKRGFADAPAAPQMFGNAGREYMERYGASAEAFARIGEKNHRHSVNNPYSQFRDEYSLQDILDSPMVYEPLTKLQCCPTSDGGGAAIVANERFVREHGLEDKAVEIVGMAMTTDYPSSFEGSDIKLVGYRHDRGGRTSGLRGVGPRPRGDRRHRAPRLLLGQRDDHVRGAGSLRRGPGPRAGPGGRHHVRRRRRGQPLRRADLQGPSPREPRAWPSAPR